MSVVEITMHVAKEVVATDGWVNRLPEMLARIKDRLQAQDVFRLPDLDQVHVWSFTVPADRVPAGAARIDPVFSLYRATPLGTGFQIHDLGWRDADGNGLGHRCVRCGGTVGDLPEAFVQSLCTACLVSWAERLTRCTICGTCVHEHGGWGHPFTFAPTARDTAPVLAPPRPGERLALPAPELAKLSSQCASCRGQFGPHRAQYKDRPFCTQCVDRCHDSEIADHRCPVCAYASIRGALKPEHGPELVQFKDTDMVLDPSTIKSPEQLAIESIGKIVTYAALLELYQSGIISEQEVQAARPKCVHCGGRGSHVRLFHEYEPEQAPDHRLESVRRIKAPLYPVPVTYQLPRLCAPAEDGSCVSCTASGECAVREQGWRAEREQTPPAPGQDLEGLEPGPDAQE